MRRLRNRPTNSNQRRRKEILEDTRPEVRAKIICDVDHGVSVGEVADKYDMSVRNVRNICRLKTKLSETLKNGGAEVRKRKKIELKLQFPQIDEGCLKFLKWARDRRIPIRPVFLKNVTTFRCSEWLDKFLRRHDINLQRLHGKTKSQFLADL
ncbi:hypothetical protein RvY_16873 [Ramazzottius varieornatus]|uniref:Uncharacterized protein n=1 Tax=Ramazzottius varieornatus TaxID=947166 RepID=A0A1D1W7A6_RAMVA|nr:hypothetical protein RvY_16873 [Ramazzottius varieornatus]